MNCCRPYGLGNKYGVTQTTGQMGYRGALTEDLDLDVNGAYQRDDYFGLWPDAHQPPGSLAIVGGTYAHDQLGYFSAFGSKDPATGDDLGGIYPVASPQFGDPYGVSTRQIAAGYLQGKLDLASRLTVTADGFQQKLENLFDGRYQPAGLTPTYFARGRTFLLGLSADL